MKLRPHQRTLPEAATPWKCDDLIPDLCDGLHVSEGSVVIRGVRVQYWKYERLPSNSKESSVPIIAIHGGPGFTHNYLLPLKEQACRGRPIYFYDQAGCGKSSLPTNTSAIDNYPWLLSVEYYSLEELPALIDHWGLSAYHIIGNSWGTVLSQVFALDAEASSKAGLQSMVLSGPLSQAKLYIDSQWSQEDGTVGSLPLYVQEQIRQLEDTGAYDCDEYREIVDILTTQFTLRTAPFPDCYLESSRTANEEIYVGMQGASEFTIAGTLGSLNMTHRLVDIHVPVLLTHGKYDTMRPAVVQAMKEKLPRVEDIMFHKSGHLSMIDEPKVMNDAIADFFNRVEKQEGYRPRDGDSSIQQQHEEGCHTALSRPDTLIVLLLVCGLGLFLVGYVVRSRRRRLDYAPVLSSTLFED